MHVCVRVCNSVCCESGRASVCRCVGKESFGFPRKSSEDCSRVGRERLTLDDVVVLIAGNLAGALALNVDREAAKVRARVSLVLGMWVMGVKFVKLVCACVLVSLCVCVCVCVDVCVYV